MGKVDSQFPVDSLTGLRASRFGIYLHFPYCLSKCPYCDFASVVAKDIPETRYLQAVEAELRLRLPELARRQPIEVDSIFLGGGTPSLWHPRHVDKLLQTLVKSFSVRSDAEVTLEANPGASDADRFAEYRRLGINRLSIGVQSLTPATLRALGRDHTPDDAENAFRAARTAKFDNVSMDFIYGVHTQTIEQVKFDALRATGWAPEHLSAYALTLEKESLAEEVPLAKKLERGEIVLPSETEIIEMGDALEEIYAAAGFVRYEISNYARDKRHSVHNLLYWTGGEYLALGAGATGCLDQANEYRPEKMSAVRYSNFRSVERYFSAVEARLLPESSRELLSSLELFAERLSMGLRLTEGIRLTETCRIFGQDSEARIVQLNKFIQQGYARREGEKVSLTHRGLNLHSAVCAALV